MRKRRSTSSLLSLQLEEEEEGDGATRFKSADSGLAFRIPVEGGGEGLDDTGFDFSASGDATTNFVVALEVSGGGCGCGGGT